MSDERRKKRAFVIAASKFYQDNKVDCKYFKVRKNHTNFFTKLKLMAKALCKFLTHPSQLVKMTDGSGDSHVDSYNYCTKLKRRINKKGSCAGCKLHTPFKHPN